MRQKHDERFMQDQYSDKPAEALTASVEPVSPIKPGAKSQTAAGEFKLVAELAQKLLEEVGEGVLLKRWIEMGGRTKNPPSAAKYLRRNRDILNVQFSSNEVSEIKVITYLLLEIIPKLTKQRAVSENSVVLNENTISSGANEEGPKVPTSRQSLLKEEEERFDLAFKNKMQEVQALLDADWQEYSGALKGMLNAHTFAFLRNMRASYHKDEYGAVIKDEREAEIERFLSSVGLLKRASKHGLSRTVQYVNQWYADRELEFEQSEAVPENGHDFERWVAAQLAKAGWTASVTQASGDDGVDVIAKREGLTVAVQCKRYAGSVGNKAVQEVYSGMRHLQLDKAVVISTGKYTKAAQNLASSTGVLLLGEHDIPHMWDLLQR